MTEPEPEEQPIFECRTQRMFTLGQGRTESHHARAGWNPSCECFILQLVVRGRGERLLKIVGQDIAPGHSVSHATPESNPTRQGVAMRPGRRDPGFSVQTSTLVGPGFVRHHCGVSVQAIKLADGPIDAVVRVPGSKSPTNRALRIERPSRPRPPRFAASCLATICATSASVCQRAASTCGGIPIAPRLASTAKAAPPQRRRPTCSSEARVRRRAHADY